MQSIGKLLAEHSLCLSAVELFEFIKESIEARELAKFLFTKNLSDALAFIIELGNEHGFSREDCSYLDIGAIIKLYSGSHNPSTALAKSVENGRQQFELSCHIVLPPQIETAQQAWSFQIPRSLPNYITQLSAKGPVRTTTNGSTSLEGTIVMIPSADPGYDWLFSCQIAGLVTSFGGVNSHMAIRAAEMGIPAVIGAGEIRFNEWQNTEYLEIDCASKKVTILR